MAVDPKEPERGIFTAFFSIPSSCACSANINSTRGNELTTSTSTNSPFLGMCENFTYFKIQLIYTSNLQEENLSEEEILQLIETQLELNTSLQSQGSRFRMNSTKIGF